MVSQVESLRKREVTSPTPFSRLVFPEDAAEWMSVLQENRDLILKREVVCRGATYDFLAGDICLDSSGYPTIPRQIINSQAFRDGGWDLVAALTEQYSGSIVEMVARADDNSYTGEVIPSPFIWTSPDTIYSLCFHSGRENDQVYMLLRPDSQRVVFDGNYFSYPPDEEIVEQTERLFLETATNNKPYLIDNPPEEGEEHLVADEILLGPYISADEILALIRIERSSGESFVAQLREVFPEHWR